MIEAGAKQVPEEQMAEAHDLAFRLIGPLLDLQDELRAKFGKAKGEMKISKIPDAVISAVEGTYGPRFKTG